MARLLAIAAVALVFLAGPARAAEGPALPTQSWSFQGMFGTYDRAALRRGFQVYSEVCASCHSLRLLSYRNLGSVGFSEDEVKAIAAEIEVEDGPNDEGDMFTRPGKPADRFASPFANEMAARAANNGALPPDLSLMVKARKGGPDYLHGLLTGYAETAPEGVTVMEGMNYNMYFPGNQIAMAAPLADEAVEYSDGTEATLDTHARDVVVFLAWASSPELEERKRLGIKVLIFLIVLTGMLYALKRQIWRDVH
jgi:cytochrome c1